MRQQATQEVENMREEGRKFKEHLFGGAEDDYYAHALELAKRELAAADNETSR
jgi:hypothetical protein